jgi:hypothetical protein
MADTTFKSPLIHLLKTYRWNELYDAVKNIEYNLSVSIQKQGTLAIKAMLLVGWWNDHITSRDILNHYPNNIKDPLAYFAIMYGYMALGDNEKIKLYKKNKPKNLPIWMSNWLELELLGRSLKDKGQIDLAKKVTPPGKYPDEYVKVAILQSLEHSHANIAPLCQWIEDIGLLKDSNELSQILCYRSGLLNYKSLKNIDHPLVYRREAISILNDFAQIEATNEFEKLTQTNYIDLISINNYLSTLISMPQTKEPFFKTADFIMNIVPNVLTMKGTVSSYMLIELWKNGQYTEAYNIIKKYHEYKNLPDSKLTKNSKVFFIYVLYLCVHWQHHREIYDEKLLNSSELYVLGESHSLSLSNINFKMNNSSYHCNSNFVMGIKMHNLSVDNTNYYSIFLLEHIKSLKQKIDVMFTIGEIDTRPNGGIWKAVHAKGLSLDAVITNTVVGYIAFLSMHLKDKNLNSITIQGIPAPDYKLEGDKDPGDKEGFLNMIKKVNEKLKELTLAEGWNFLDVYAATVAEDGMSNKKWHLDGYHLQPLFYTQADQWLIKPESSN